MRSKRATLLSSESGSSLVETAVFLPLLFLLLLGVVDFGRAYYLADEVAGAAQAGAVYGSQNITDTSGMANVAKLDAPDVSGMTATGSWGCECSDGTNPSTSCAAKPACGVNLVYYATVTTSVTYKPMIPWPGFGSSKGIGSSFTISRSVTMRSATE
ncbi:MAG: TadE/TadG family type IV pilus assembly protein [Terracidiphilus sp.]